VINCNPTIYVVAVFSYVNSKADKVDFEH